MHKFDKRPYAKKLLHSINASKKVLDMALQVVIFCFLSELQLADIGFSHLL
jgi:hypothetical protein